MKNWGGERNVVYKSVKNSLQQMRFKNLEQKSERESPKKIISANGRLGPSTAPDRFEFATIYMFISF